MRTLAIWSLMLLFVFSDSALQVRGPRHDHAVLIPQSDLIIIGQVRGRKYVAHESIKEYFDIGKNVGELVELVAQEVLLDLSQKEPSLKPGVGLPSVQVYVLGRPFGTDREVLFLPNETYLVFLSKYKVEPEKTPALVMWNQALKKWEKFPDPSGTYFTVIDGGDGLVPQKARYQNFINETRRICHELRGRR